MKLIDRHDVAAQMVASYRRWLFRGMTGSPKYVVELAKKMAALPDRPNPDDVDRIEREGRGTPDVLPTHLECDECRERVEAVVEVGEEMDRDSSTARLCAKCLLAAFVLIEPG